MAALTIAVAGVQLVATRRKAEQRQGVDIPLEARRSLSPTGPNDRTAGHDQLAAQLERELTPLAHECIQQAKARSPSLRGMLTLRLEIVSDEPRGAIVEGAEVPATSEVQERELAECLRERAMTLTFPPPVSRGPDQFELTFIIPPPSSEQRP